MPTFGAALCIVARLQGGIGVIFTNRIAKSIGLMSYSLYLVHWPIIVYVIHLYGELTPTLGAICLAMSFLLAALQYKFIEQPLRKPLGARVEKLSATGSFSRGLAAASCASIAMLGLALIVRNFEGLPGRFSGEIAEIAAYGEQAMQGRWRRYGPLCRGVEAGELCGQIVSDRVNILIVGDSHAIDSLNALSESYPGANLLILQKGGCPFYEDLTGIPHADRACASRNVERKQTIVSLQDELDAVVIAQRFVSGRVQPFTPSLAWAAALDVPVVVVGPAPEFSDDLLEIFLRADSAVEGNRRAVEEYLVAEQFAVNVELQDLARLHGIAYIDRLKRFCPSESNCNFVIQRESGVALAMVDSNHLTWDGAAYLGAALAEDSDEPLSGILN